MTHIIEVKSHRGQSSFRACIYIIMAVFLVLVWQWRQAHERAERERHERQSAAADSR
jgi:hypothetical protein